VPGLQEAGPETKGGKQLSEQGKPASSSELLKLANHALLQAKAQLDLQGDLPPIFILRTKNGQLHRLPMSPELAQLMDNGDAKDMIFGSIRRMVQESKCTASVFITDGWVYPPTDKKKKLSTDEQNALLDYNGTAWMHENGYLWKVEMLVCTVQTAERALIRRVAYERTPYGVNLSPPEDWEMPIDDFGGRQKMFGDLSEENLGRDPNTVRREQQEKREGRKAV